MQQKIAQKEKESNEENLRLLAQRSRKNVEALLPKQQHRVKRRSSRLWLPMAATMAVPVIVGQKRRTTVRRMLARFEIKCARIRGESINCFDWVGFASPRATFSEMSRFCCRVSCLARCS